MRRTALLASLAVFGAAVAVRTPAAPKQTATYESLLAVWRKPGRILDAACASCHGPDGLELAMYNFDDATILRRARPHLNEEDSESVVAFVHEVRRKYRIQVPYDLLRQPPLQPDGSALRGDSAAERDFAFGESLRQVLPTLVGPPILDLAAARKATAELARLDPNDLKIGFSLNPLSEDVERGSEHASLADWIPDVPRVTGPNERQRYYDLQDAYLADPSDENLWKMIDGFSEITRPIAATGIAQLADAKYRSLLLLQHQLRRSRMVILGNDQAPVMLAAAHGPIPANPFWEVGDFARRSQGQSLDSLGLDPDLRAKKAVGPSFDRQMMEMQSSWFWLGWLFDPSLERTSRQPAVNRGDWLAVALWNAGPYPMHIAFAIAKKQEAANELPEAFGRPAAGKQTEWDYLGMRIGGRYISDMPTQPEHRRLYCHFTANCFRMSLLEMLDEWNRTKQVWYRKASLNHVRALTEFIGKYDPASPTEATDLETRCNAAIGRCTERYFG